MFKKVLNDLFKKGFKWPFSRGQKLKKLSNTEIWLHNMLHQSLVRENSVTLTKHYQERNSFYEAPP